MTSTTELLREYGLAKVDQLSTAETVAEWNQRLSGYLSDDDERSYVSASQLLDSGVLTEIFTPRVRSAIRQISPNAVIYHCHAYEIAANRDASHVHSGPFAGWHADCGCSPLYHKGSLGFISMFIHLTDVDEPENGAFEIRPETPSEPLKHGQKSIHLLGPAGAGFFFHRSFFHRASPNKSNVRRRVFKLSIQDRGQPHHDRRNLEEYVTVSNALRDSDPFLSQLFETDNVDPSWMLPELADAADFDSYVPESNSTISLPVAGRLRSLLAPKKLAA